ncbi:MAG TPA: DUF1801 domain-containing protein [Candidatus Angelobacter sp.]|jgi:hypothetical protein|nr:DUF1801 domain-containing protein [Candidatus Angelobacter sp.]
MAENKTKPTAASVAAFISTIPDPTQQKDAKTLVKWMEHLSGEKAKLWGPSIIGVGSYHYKYDTGREGDIPILSFSPRKSATVLYSLMGFSGSEALLAKLGKHTTGKGCVYIKKLTDVNEQVLKDLMATSLAAKRARGSS